MAVSWLGVAKCDKETERGRPLYSFVCALFTLQYTLLRRRHNVIVGIVLTIIVRTRGTMGPH